MQIRIFFKILTTSLIGIVLMAAIFYFYSNREINDSFRQFHIHAKNFLDYLLPAVLLSILAAVLSSAAVTIFFPHKIAGPIYRIEQAMKEKISSGDLTVRFKLRKGDEVGDLAEALNSFLDKLKVKIENAKQPAEELSAVISGEKYDDEAVRDLVKKINEALKEFKT
jgi:methyl-accepting chemotaxis protein